MNILVCNDDGIYSEGLNILAENLKTLGNVVVIAPDQERSAISHAITFHSPLRINEMRKNVYSVNGTPADCIILGIYHIFKNQKVDLIVSGINRGANLGGDVIYSGTVAAAREGAMNGIPSMAISLNFGSSSGFEIAAKYANKISSLIFKYSLPKGTLLNVNVPNVTAKDIKGIRITKLGKRFYPGNVIEKEDPYKRKYYWIGGNLPIFEEDELSDSIAILNNFVSVTPLKLDTTDDYMLKELLNWEL